MNPIQKGSTNNAFNTTLIGGRNVEEDRFIDNFNPLQEGSARHAFGFCYRKDKDLGLDGKQLVEQDRNTVVLYNVLNGLGWVLSPIIGIIRIVATLCLWRNEANTGFNDPNQDQYCIAQISRGVAEVLCLGAIFAAVDPIITALRYFPKAQIV